VCKASKAVVFEPGNSIVKKIFTINLRKDILDLDFLDRLGILVTLCLHGNFYLVWSALQFFLNPNNLTKILFSSFLFCFFCFLFLFSSLIVLNKKEERTLDSFDCT